MSDVEPMSVRAGNDDRERVVARLNTAFAEGRLDVGELDERVVSAYAAKTLGDLVPLTADLPEAHRRGPSVPVPRAAAGDQPVPAHAQHPGRGAPIAGTLAIVGINLVVWAAVSIGNREWIYFWPIWTTIPLIIAVASVLGQGRSRRGR